MPFGQDIRCVLIDGDILTINDPVFDKIAKVMVS